MPQSDKTPVNPGAVKVIVCDLDGTLLNSKKLISPANLRAVNAVRERGMFVTICTGRIPEMTEAYIRFLGIRGPVITANGAVIIDTQDNSVPYRECADGSQSVQLLEFCARRGFDHLAAAVEGCYYSRNSERVGRFVQYNTIAQKDHLKQIPLFQIDDYDVIKKLNIYKLLAAGLSQDEQREVEAFAKTLSGLSYTSSERGLLDIGAAGVNKGSGIRGLARIMGISTDEICVFGDYCNDIPMFEASGFSVAMENGDELVKNRASVITGSNDEDGVAGAIERYFLGA